MLNWREATIHVVYTHLVHSIQLIIKFCSWIDQMYDDSKLIFMVSFDEYFKKKFNECPNCTDSSSTEDAE